LRGYSAFQPRSSRSSRQPAQMPQSAILSPSEPPASGHFRGHFSERHPLARRCPSPSVPEPRGRPSACTDPRTKGSSIQPTPHRSGGGDRRKPGSRPAGTVRTWTCSRWPKKFFPREAETKRQESHR
jgi:hypothetical protein